MRHNDESLPSLWKLALLGGLMGILAAAMFMVQPLATLIVRYDVNVALRSIEGGAILSGTLSRQVAAYAASVMLVHGALGVLAAVLAWAWAAAFPSCRAALSKLTFLWLAALLAWVIVSNAIWFPLADSSTYYTRVLQGIGGAQQLPLILALALGLLALVPLVKLLPRLVRGALLLPRPIVAGFVLVSASSVAAGVASSAWKSGTSATGLPNVVLIGVDSLRLDSLGANGGSGDTPNLDDFLSESAVFRDTITPLSRTFPAWVSILTGQHPRTHGAVANLVERSTVDASNALGFVLRKQGYASILATDEVRFANIDQSYGFDTLITPRIGASDFLLGTLNDLPLANILSLTAAGRWLFPSSYANRAVAATYEPEIFLNRLRAEIPSDASPLFLALHLAVAHFPYHTSKTTAPPEGLSNADVQMWRYREGLRTADRMFGQVIELLEQRGLLQNAIVVVLSDHGEALLQPTDRLVAPDDHAALGAERPIEVPYLGHGTSVLSPSQFQVLLAFRRLGGRDDDTKWPAPGTYDTPATLEDVAPTLVAGLGFHIDATKFDGRALLGESAQQASWSQRIRFTETDFNVPGTLAGVINPVRIAEEGVKYYSIDPDSGWLYLKPSVMPDVYDMKQRAAMQGDWILAALPTLDAGTRYLLINTQTRAGRLLLGAPDPDDEPAAALWAALHSRFPGELRAPSQ